MLTIINQIREREFKGAVFTEIYVHMWIGVFRISLFVDDEHSIERKEPILYELCLNATR